MRVPQVSERIKEVPAQALRGVFAGIGQLLLITDKLRNKTPAAGGVPRARTPERSGPAPDAAAGKSAVSPEKATQPAPAQPTAAEPPAAKAAPPKPDAAKAATAKAAATKAAAAKPARTEAPKPTRTPPTRDFDKTGNVRLLDDAETSAATSVSPVPAEAAAPVSPAAAAATPEAEPVSAAPAAGSEPGDSGAPLPNYDELSVASLRARLRNLDVGQVRRLAEYERAHAARADVITMFERRIAKLEADA
jgi:hypothetical protein